MYGQTFEPHDIAIVGLLIVLEGVLSIDNALVLGILAKRLPKNQQSRALTYGLVGAFVFRLIAIATAAWLLHWRVVKLIGGGYLIYIAVKHLFFESREDEKEHVTTSPEGEPMLVAARTHQPLSEAQAETAIRERSPIPAPGAATPSPDECVVPGQPRKCAKFWPTVVVIEL